MRNIWLLTKNYFNTFIGSFAKNKKIGKYLLALLIIGSVSLLMTAFFAFNSYVITNEFIMLSKDDYKYANFAMFYNSSTLILLATLMVIMRAASPSEVTDANLLLSLPIKKSEIIIAKSLASYFFDFIVLLGFLFPSYIIYVVLVPTSSALLIGRGFLLLLLIPLLTNALSIIIGTLVNVVTRKFRFAFIIQVVLIFVLICAFLVFNFYINDLLTSSTSLDINETLELFLPIKMIYQFVLENNWISFCIMFLVVVIIYVLAVIIRKNHFGKTAVYYKSKKQDLNFQEKSVFRDIFNKECSRFFSLPIYITNVTIGIVLVIGASIYIAIKGRDFLDLIINQILRLDSTHTPYIIMITMGMVLSTVCTTYCSISLEGKTLWILKALPIEEKTIFKSKITFNLCLAGIGILISSIFVSSILGFKYLLLFIMFPFLLTAINASMGLLLNLIYPKLEWESEVVPIKQSFSVMIVMTIGTIIPALFLIMYLLLCKTLPVSIIVMIFFIILIGLNIIIYYLLKTKGVKLFKKLN